MKKTWIILFTSYFIPTSSDIVGNVDIERAKRQINSIPLVYPYGATYKLILGFSAPVPNKDKINLAFAANFQYQYVQFQNISDLSQYYFIKTVAREERDIEGRRNERLTFYAAFAKMLEAKGFNGQDCVLRAICEAAQFPVKDEGLVGEIIHILLTPDYGKSPFEDEHPSWEEDIAIYKDAATAGRQMFNCPSIYTSCPEGQGIMDMISMLCDE